MDSVIFSDCPTDRKSECNIQSQMEKIADLLPDNLTKNRGLINPFRKLTANKTQAHDLLKFHEIGTAMFENRVEAYILKTPSVKAPMYKPFLLHKNVRTRRLLHWNERSSRCRNA